MSSAPGRIPLVLAAGSTQHDGEDPSPPGRSEIGPEPLEGRFGDDRRGVGARRGITGVVEPGSEPCDAIRDVAVALPPGCISLEILYASVGSTIPIWFAPCCR